MSPLFTETRPRGSRRASPFRSRPGTNPPSTLAGWLRKMILTDGSLAALTASPQQPTRPSNTRIRLTTRLDLPTFTRTALFHRAEDTGWAGGLSALALAGHHFQRVNGCGIPGAAGRG